MFQKHTYHFKTPQHAGVVAEGRVHLIDESDDGVTIHEKLIPRLSGLGYMEEGGSHLLAGVEVKVVKVVMVVVKSKMVKV